MAHEATYPEAHIMCRNTLDEPACCHANEGGTAPSHIPGLALCYMWAACEPCSHTAGIPLGKEDAARSAHTAHCSHSAGNPLGTGAQRCFEAVGRDTANQNNMAMSLF
jgi:hypothetical protein